MSEKAWDDEDVEVPSPVHAAVQVIGDKWDGEDEDKVKDNWDDEDDVVQEKPATSAASTVATKKTRKQTIAEKQAQKEAELQSKRLEIQKISADMTPEERLAEKLRVQKMQEESDLQCAVDMMGIRESDLVPEVESLTDADLTTAAGLEALGTAVLKKVRATDRLEKKNYYVPFLESFCKDLCINLEVDELKKVTASLNALYNDKVKANKPVKGKKKVAGKAKLHVGKESDVVDNDRYIDDFDDFI